MKVQIGPYLSWVGPYQLADLLRYVGVSESTRFRFGEWLSTTWVGTVCQKIYDLRQRKVYIHIDKWDSWNAFVTITMVALPIIRQLRDTAHGSPYVDIDDVPPELQATDYADQMVHYDQLSLFEDHVDNDMIHRRWQWVLGEIIWALEQLHPDHEDTLYDLSPEQSARLKRGLTLFGVYFTGLWD
jgi:hypothetical protein